MMYIVKELTKTIQQRLQKARKLTGS